MQISFNGIESLKDLEGLRLNAYLDSAGIATIGYGTIKIDGKPVEMGMTCTEQEATVYLQADLAWAQTAVNQLVRVSLTQPEFDALVSFVYNVGQGAFAKSTMLRKLNAGDYEGAAKEFPRWNIAGGKVVKGLVARRRIEQAMFSSK